MCAFSTLILLVGSFDL